MGEPVDPMSLPDAMDRLDDFWEAFRPEMRYPCPDECGKCDRCVASWALSWTYAALSNATLVTKAQEKQATSDGCGTTPLKVGTIPTPQNPATPDRLAARGAGDGLAGRLRELCDRKYVAFNPTGSGYESYIRCDDVLALLDPDAQDTHKEA